MRHKDIERKFRRIFALRIRPGTKGERAAATGAALRMVERWPWLRDVARQMGYNMPGPHTRDLYPDQAQASSKPSGKTRAQPSAQASPRARPFVNPPAPRGYKYQQCGKPTCRCMNGGPWHGPYRYRSERVGASVTSHYEGKYTGEK